MNKKRIDDATDYENELNFSGSATPVRKRSEKKRTPPKAGRTARGKKGVSHRKGNTKGGIHQRANKRMSW